MCYGSLFVALVLKRCQIENINMNIMVVGTLCVVFARL